MTALFSHFHIIFSCLIVLTYIHTVFFYYSNRYNKHCTYISTQHFRVWLCSCTGKITLLSLHIKLSLLAITLSLLYNATLVPTYDYCFACFACLAFLTTSAQPGRDGSFKQSWMPSCPNDVLRPPLWETKLGKMAKEEMLFCTRSGVTVLGFWHLKRRR